MVYRKCIAGAGLFCASAIFIVAGRRADAQGILEYATTGSGVDTSPVYLDHYPFCELRVDERGTALLLVI